MRYLLDTHVLLWAAGQHDRLSAAAQALLNDQQNQLFFSSASIWEVVIKRALGRSDFVADPRLLRHGLLNNGYTELPVTSEHALMVETLPPLHKDPFDRMLVGQAMAEPMKLITADGVLAQYTDLVMLV
ncbi:MAG: type II toxin-antitoxin system VapC family toxin [Ottowia sp.]|nr:type II toxin-antitoxin system VapC family toxin [Ottowia sp.]